MPLFESESRKRTALAGLALLVILVAIFFIVHARRTHTRPPVDFSDVKVTTVLAEESAKLLGSRGRIVIVALDPETMPSTRAQLDDLKKALARFSSVTVLATEIYSPEPRVPRCTIPAPLFFDMLQRHPKLDAIVSLLGAPELSEKELAQLDPETPKVLMFSPCASNLKPLFEAGLLHLAIIPSGHLPAATDKKPSSARAKFNLLFRVITPATANTLPD